MSDENPLIQPSSDPSDEGALRERRRGRLAILDRVRANWSEARQELDPAPEELVRKDRER